MWIHTNCYCRICAGRNIPSSSPVSPLSPSFHRRFVLDTPPSPLSPALSFTDSFRLPSFVSPMLCSADEPLSPVSPFALEPLSPVSESSTAPPSPTLSIAELTPGDFPSPSSPLTTAYIWDLCIIPSVPTDPSIFGPKWCDESSAPFDTPATRIDDKAVSPKTLPNGENPICSSPGPPPLPQRPIPRRPRRSPLLTSKFSWGSSPTTSPSLKSPDSFRFTGPIYTFETVAEEVKSQAGSLSLASSHGVGVSVNTPSSPRFENKPWWETIPPVSAPPSPTLSVHSFSGFSGVHYSASVSEFASPCPSPVYAAGFRDTRNIYWTSATPQTAAEYLSIFGISVFEDPFAWIRYPVPGPHDLCTYCSDDEDDDESAGYDWDAHNPTAPDSYDPFGEIDELLALYCDSDELSFVSSYLSFDAYSEVSFDLDEYSGITENAGVADTAEIQRARFVESYLVGSVVSAVKEVCVEDCRVGSIDLILASSF